MGNALKFTYKGHIKIYVKYENSMTTTIVEDTGIGISEEDQSKLFKFFGKLDISI